MIKQHALLGFGAGVVVSAAIYMVLPSSGDPSHTEPNLEAMMGTQGKDAKIESIDASLGDWKAWLIYSRNGYRQTAFSMPGQPGVLVGQLYDQSGAIVGREAAYSREREITSIEDIEDNSAWVSRTFENPASTPEIQSAQAGEGSGQPLYVIADPFDPGTRQHEAKIRKLIQDGARIIPAPANSAETFDGLQAIMEGGGPDNPNTLDAFLTALGGASVLQQGERGDPSHKEAFIAFSKNVSLQSLLGIERLPAVIEASDQSGVSISPLQQSPPEQD